MNAKTEHKTIVFFDGCCGLCNNLVRFILRHERNTELQFAALQSAFATERHIDLQALPDSLVLFENEVYYSESEAALRLCRYLKWYLRWMGIFLYVPRFIRNAIYRWVAQNRHVWFARTDYCSDVGDYKVRIII